MTADNTEPRCQLHWAENRQNMGHRSNFPNGPDKHWSWGLQWEILYPLPQPPCVFETLPAQLHCVAPCKSKAGRGTPSCESPSVALHPRLQGACPQPHWLLTPAASSPQRQQGDHNQDRCVVISKQLKWPLLISRSWGSADALSELILTSPTIRIPLHFSFFFFLLNSQWQ